MSLGLATKGWASGDMTVRGVQSTAEDAEADTQAPVAAPGGMAALAKMVYGSNPGRGGNSGSSPYLYILRRSRPANDSGDDEARRPPVQLALGGVVFNQRHHLGELKSYLKGATQSRFVQVPVTVAGVMAAVAVSLGLWLAVLSLAGMLA